MDPFKASLAHYRIELLMPVWVEAPNLSGTLKVQRGGLKREFVIQEGALVAECSSDPREHLAQVLANLRIVEAPRAASAYEGAEAAGVALGTFLVERGFMERARLLEVLEHKAREAFFDCYQWESGEIEFTPWDVKRVRGEELKLRLGGLHRDAMARQREWRSFQGVFPRQQATFDVARQFGVESTSDENDALLALAETGATLAEILAAAREGPLFGARRVLQLYRLGVLTLRENQGPKVGAAAEVGDLLALARECVRSRQFQRAADVAAQALEQAPVPEAQALYREAEQQLALTVSEKIVELEERLAFEPLSLPLPATLTADDLYLYSKLKSARSIRTALRSAAMGELAAFRSVERLITSGLVRTLSPPPGARLKTDPFVPTFTPT